MIKLAITLLPTIISLALALAPAPYNPEKLPYHTTWGPYTIVVEKTGKETFALQRLRILNKAGQVLREVQDYRFPLVEPVSLMGRPGDALRVSAYTGGAHCCTTEYFFTGRGGLKNLLIFEGGNDGINGIKDLNGDGRAEIVGGNDVLAYRGDLPYAASPHLSLVIGWNGRRYTDQTRRYSQFAEKSAREYQQICLKAARQPGDEGRLERRSGAAGFYGSMLTLGRGGGAAKWLQAHLSPADQQWFRRYQPDFRRAVATTSSKIRRSQAKLLKPMP